MEDTLILTFYQGEKEPPLPFSPLGREGRAAPSEGKGVGVGEGWSEGRIFTFRNPVSGIRNYFVTVIFPPSPRAFTFRSYIDSAKTGGTTKFPRLHDLI